MKRVEQSIHISIAGYLNLMLPVDAFWMHVPNGGYRTKTEGGVFKAMGVRKGVWDILIFWRGGAYAVEVKAPGEDLSDAQTETGEQMAAAGVRLYGVVRSIDDMRLALTTWQIPMRFKVAA